jgi:hypothetical protein
MRFVVVVVVVVVPCGEFEIDAKMNAKVSMVTIPIAVNPSKIGLRSNVFEPHNPSDSEDECFLIKRALVQA